MSGACPETLNPSLTPLFSSVTNRRSSLARDAPPPLVPLMRGRVRSLGRRTRQPRTALAAGLVRVVGTACRPERRPPRHARRLWAPRAAAERRARLRGGPAGALLACHAHLRGERLERHRRLGPLMRARVALGGEQARASRGAGRPRTTRARACGRRLMRGSVRAPRHERRPVLAYSQ